MRCSGAEARARSSGHIKTSEGLTANAKMAQQRRKAHYRPGEWLFESALVRPTGLVAVSSSTAWMSFGGTWGGHSLD
jgi:hypothetical protein